MVQDVLSLLRPHEGRRQTSFAGLSSLLSTSTEPPHPIEPIGVELQQLVDALARSGRELLGAADPRLSTHIQEMLNHIAAISGRVAVVGQVKAGKSSFINALMQRGELLPTHVNPWTAVATKLHFGTPGKPLTGCDFTFFTAEEWADLGRKAEGESGEEFEDGFPEMKSRAEMRLGDNFHHLLGKTHFYQSVQPGILQNYLCAGPPVDEISREVKPGRYADITKTANVYFPLPPMAVPATLIDTPGINDSTHLRHRITREVIEGADIYIVVLTARQPLASSDLALLKLLRGLEKKRIVVFINRIDELSERAGAMEIVVRHVKDELDKIFEGASIPVVAGSAKWAGLAALSEDEIETLRREVQTPAFKAVAAQKSIEMPRQEDEKEERAALRKALATASGLEAVSKLLSLFMLSGFVAHHAKGVSTVLSEAADISATNASRQLRSVTELARNLAKDLQTEQSQSAESSAELDRQLGEIEALIDAIENGVYSLKREADPAISDGIGRLESALEADIRSFGASKQGQPPSISSPTGEVNGSAASIPAAARKDEPARTGEHPDWLTSVKEATVDFLRKAFADSPPPKAKSAAPSTVRRASLTVPVTTRAKAVSIEAEKTWWSEWMSSQHLASEKTEELTRFVRQEFAPQKAEKLNGSGGQTLQELSEHAARLKGLTSIEPLTKLVEQFRAMGASENALSDDGRARLAAFVADHDKTVNDACLAIAVNENVIRQVRSLFTPPKITG